MNQQQQNIRSNQRKEAPTSPAPDMVQEDKYHHVYIAFVDAGQIYTELTYRFPTTYISGNKYILVLYDYDSNTVNTAPMKKHRIQGNDASL
jgi:hypothetical protein